MMTVMEIPLVFPTVQVPRLGSIYIYNSLIGIVTSNYNVMGQIKRTHNSSLCLSIVLYYKIKFQV